MTIFGVNKDDLPLIMLKVMLSPSLASVAFIVIRLEYEEPTTT